MPALPATIQLIVGLGNPGREYANTRHNAGAWFAQKVASRCHTELRFENKFKGFHAVITEAQHRCHLLIPATFMNLSGDAIKSISAFYQLLPENILVAHDELDLGSGEVRLKYAGGHGGHNGLRDIIAKLGTADFYRLRIGIGHPGAGLRHLVTDYVLSKPSRQEQDDIDLGIDSSLAQLPYLWQGDIAKAMQQLHTKG